MCRSWQAPSVLALATLFLVARPAPAAGQEWAAGCAEDRVEAALMPLPQEQREGATVLAEGEEGTVTLRRGEGAFICLAPDPSSERFHVACYHRSLEPYMARGRELRAQGVTGRDNIARRWEEIEEGRLRMPEHPATLYSLSSGEDDELRRLTVIYVPFATAEELGLPTAPGEDVPWLMFPGRPTAHIMIHDQ